MIVYPMASKTTIAVTTIFNIVSYSSVLLCPAWFQGKNGDTYGPIFSIVGNKWTTSTLPTCCALFVTSMYVGLMRSGKADNRINMNAFFATVMSIMFSTMATPGLGFVPLFPVFFGGLLGLFNIMVAAYFPEPPPVNVWAKLFEDCPARVKDVFGDKAHTTCQTDQSYEVLGGNEEVAFAEYNPNSESSDDESDRVVPDCESPSD